MIAFRIPPCTENKLDELVLMRLYQSQDDFIESMNKQPSSKGFVIVEFNTRDDYAIVVDCLERICSMTINRLARSQMECITTALLKLSLKQKKHSLKWFLIAFTLSSNRAGVKNPLILVYPIKYNDHNTH